MTTRLQLHRRLPAARAAVAVGFMLSGIAFASWVVRIPDAQERLGLSEGSLGLVLLGVAVGGLVAMPLSSALIARLGSRPVARGATLALAAALGLSPWAPTPLTLALVLVVLGASASILSVGMNTQAASIERRMRRPIMAGLHALYSLGGLVGAGIGGLAAGMDVPVELHLGVAALVVAAVTLATTPALLRPGIDGVPAGGPAFVRPSRPLLLMGLVAFCVLFGEGAVADWSAVYLRDAAGAGPALAAAGYAAFSLMMAAGRFVGDALTLRLGPTGLVRLGGATALGGMVMAVAQWHPLVAVVGFGAVGAGLSAVFPTVLAAAGRSRDSTPSTAITAVSSIGYLGFLAGPPLIGFIAEATTLQVGIGVVGLTSLLILLLAGAVPETPGYGRRAAEEVVGRRSSVAGRRTAGSARTWARRSVGRSPVGTRGR
jgi:MFS family permease